ITPLIGPACHLSENVPGLTTNCRSIKDVLMGNDSYHTQFQFRLDNGNGANCPGLNMEVYGIRENDSN
ncbi:MAG: hypothetical protein VYA17_08915, partial [Pseudomonadota bacterium]|nr:hypothetical protein [Pseudomonadota bacterium]